MKTNVIIGRFQTDRLTEGHRHLVDSVMKKRPGADLVFFIGNTELDYTSKNPIKAEARAKMLKKEYPDCKIRVILDRPSDEVWSQNIDSNTSEFRHPVLFGGRDSFIPHYRGKYKCIEIKSLPGVSATDRRKFLGRKYFDHPWFRAGIIHAIENRFPTAYATVDIAVLRYRQENTEYNFLGEMREGWDFTAKREILLGRKPGRTKYCFIGGFVDPSDSCLEVAAGRELSEEVPGIITHEFKYIGSTKADDFRYKNTKDGIITSLFLTYKLGGNEIPSDDIEECRWFNIHNFDKSILTEHHHILLEMLLKHLKMTN